LKGFPVNPTTGEGRNMRKRNWEVVNGEEYRAMVRG